MPDPSPTPQDSPVICGPYAEPTQHWELNDGTRRTFSRIVDGRRPSLLELPMPVEEGEQGSLIEENVTVNEIRGAVGRWRRDGYELVTPMTKRLLNHWTDDDTDNDPRPFFAQVEALETLIYLTEAAPHEAQGRRLLQSLSEANDKFNDGINRMTVKMATGTGKTVVMAMTIAWQTLNAAAPTLPRKHRKRYHKNFLVITPGLTVKERLAELEPSTSPNVYDDMNLVPADLRATLNAKARVSIHNYHRFKQRHRFSDVSRDGRKLLGVDGDEHMESVEALMKRLMPDVMRSGEPVCVLNDEAHHCYSPTLGSKADKDEKERAALWFNALKSLDEMGRLGAVYDYSATPLFIERSDRAMPPMFPWVVSDYPLIDAVEAGLVKIPRVPVSDDSGGQVAARNLFRAVEQERGKGKDNTKLELSDLPAQLVNEVAKIYGHYEDVSAKWAVVEGQRVPPVLIVVADKIKNAETFYQWLATNEAPASGGKSFELFSNDDAERALARHEADDDETDDTSEGDAPPTRTASKYPPSLVRTLLVHSKIEGGSIAVRSKTGTALMKHQAQMLVPGSADKDASEIMREALKTVGKEGRLGQNVRCVVSVSMLTEGWDTKTVTHIVGYRAFGTQLLCEQVTGRALRRLDYQPEDGGSLLKPIYAEVVGVPFRFEFPQDGDGEAPDPPISYEVCVMPERTAKLILWPNLIGYARAHANLTLAVDPAKFGDLTGIARNRASMTRLVGTHGEPLVIAQDDPQASRLRSAAARVTAAVVERVRLGECAGYTNDDSRMIARADLYQQMFEPILTWLGDPTTGFAEDDYDLVNYWQSLVSMVEAVMPGVRATDDDGQPTPKLARLSEVADVLTTEVAQFDAHRKDHYPANLQQTTQRSHLNVAPCDSQLEVAIAAALDNHPDVDAWVRNYKLGWTIPWFNEQRGRWHGYIPDFVARIGGGPDDAHAVHLIVEGKGVRTLDSEAKKRFTTDWWIPAVENAVEVLGSQHWEFWEYSPQQELGADYRANLAEEMNAAIARCLTRSRELKLSTSQSTERS